MCFSLILSSKALRKTFIAVVLILPTPCLSKSPSSLTTHFIGRAKIPSFPDFIKKRSIDNTRGSISMSSKIMSLEKTTYMSINVRLKSNKLDSYEEKFLDKNLKISGKAEGDKFILKITKTNKTTTHEFDLDETLQVSESIPWYIGHHWKNILAGNPIKINMIIGGRGISISMEASRVTNPAKDLDRKIQTDYGQELVKVRLEPTNFVLRLLGDPNFLWFDAKTRQLVRYEGALIPVKDLATSTGIPPRGTMLWREAPHSKLPQ